VWSLTLAIICARCECRYSGMIKDWIYLGPLAVCVNLLYILVYIVYMIKFYDREAFVVEILTDLQIFRYSD
jgi:hypothetical protein